MHFRTVSLPVSVSRLGIGLALPENLRFPLMIGLQFHMFDAIEDEFHFHKRHASLHIKSLKSCRRGH